MDFTVTCTCDARTPVAPSQAGGVILCRCGKQVPVPSLRALKKSAGASYIPASSLAKVRALIAIGELPPPGPCPFSGDVADATVFLRVECERPWTHRDGASDALTLAFTFFGGFIGFLASGFVKGPQRVHGHEVAIDVPLRINSRETPRLARLRQRRLKNLLVQTPAYKQLLRDYPRAHIAAA